MQIAILLFPRLTALDAIGPYELLQRLPDATVTFVGRERGAVRTENGFLGLQVDATLDEVTRPDVVIVARGGGSMFRLPRAPAGPGAAACWRMAPTASGFRM